MSPTVQATIFWVGLISVVGIYIYRKRRANKVDYSLGLDKLVAIRKLLKKGQFTEAESIIHALKSDEFTQVIDYTALSLKEIHFKKWEDYSPSSELVKLFFGVYYLHQAWIHRSHAVAIDVSQDQYQNFYDNLDKAENKLSNISNETPYGAEVFARNIRLYMGKVNYELSDQNFKKAVAKDSENVWAYLHQCEAIQPKWRGDDVQLKNFIQNLPETPIIRTICMLKLCLDSFIVEGNYFEDSVEDLRSFAIDLVYETDKKIKLQPVQSLHRFLVYNYLKGLTGVLEMEEMKEKYDKIVGRYYTLYPFGINL